MNERAASTTTNHKEAATDFLNLVASGKIREAYQKHVGPGFRHHNPFFRGDAESLMAGSEESHGKYPNKVLVVQRTLQDGDLVAVHSRVNVNPGDRGAALVHIFRFQRDRIVELWDIGQPATENSPNVYGMF